MLGEGSGRDESSKMFGPLTFEDSEEIDGGLEGVETRCLLCDSSFNLGIRLDIFLKHLLEVHNLVVEDVQNIKGLPRYIQYWREKFTTTPIEEIIPTVRIDSTDSLYFVLSTLLQEDEHLRHKLRLEHVLKVQEFERTDSKFMRTCLFCRLNFEGSRPEFINHLSIQHNLQLGNPQNLVFIDEFIEKIDEKLNCLKCLYCDRVFPERNILKEHMRKKIHKRVNIKNTEFDKYYVVNYLEPRKNWKAIQREEDNFLKEENSDEDYSDWREKEDAVICLFCERKETDINMLCLHMEADHGFDFVEETKDLDFYQKVKCINYVRRQIHGRRCVFCDVVFENLAGLQQHLLQKQHCKLPKITLFDQPEFYFPTYENDALLYLIDDVED